MADAGVTVPVVTETTEVVLVIDEGDNAWMLISSALVLMMTPALGFFYGGLVHRKNILNQLFLSFVCMGVVLVQWVLIGFSFAFGPPVSPGFGSFGDSALTFGTRLDPIYTPTYPLLTFAIYQGTFAIITPALISGSIVGRMRVVPYMIFVFIWTTVCYDPMAHWVWGENGWLRHYESLDFAGGTVVHILSGVSGFVASMILGKRIDYGDQRAGNHNIPFTVLGTALLWVGWTGFNGGSANTANQIASLAVVNTHASAAAGLLTWTVLDAIRGHLSVSGSCMGPIIGLVCITPACGFIQPGWSLLFGIIGTCIIYVLLLYKEHLGVDDTLDVALVHGVGGTIGAFLTGLFSDQSINPAGVNGAFYGRPIQMWKQLAGILTAIGFGGACTALILFPLDWLIGIRLTAEEEMQGLDVIEHGEAWGGTTNRKPNEPVASRENFQNRAGSAEISSFQQEQIRRARSASKVRSKVRVRPEFSRYRQSNPRSYTRGVPAVNNI